MCKRHPDHCCVFSAITFISEMTRNKGVRRPKGKWLRHPFEKIATNAIVIFLTGLGLRFCQERSCSVGSTRAVAALEGSGSQVSRSDRNRGCLSRRDLKSSSPACPVILSPVALLRLKIFMIRGTPLGDVGWVRALFPEGSSKQDCIFTWIYH